MSFDLSKIPPASRDAFVRRIAVALASSAFARRSMWRHAFVFDTDEGCHVTSRADAVSYFATNDLPTLAREVTSRRVQPGEVIVFLQRDRENVAVSSVMLVDLASELARVRAKHMHARGISAT